MPLNIAHHKSYHPYNRENVEKVRKDEEEVRRKDEARQHQKQVADAEARLQLLRAERNKTKAVDTSVSNDDQVSQSPHEIKEGSSSQGGKSEGGHINFWATLESREAAHPTPRGSKPSVTGPASGSKKAAVQENTDDQTTVYLGGLEKEGKPWYSDPHLRGPKERRKTQDETLEAAYKDSALKSSYDPLKAMSEFLAQREQAVQRRRREEELRKETQQEGRRENPIDDQPTASSSSYRHYVNPGWRSSAAPKQVDTESKLRGTLHQTQQEGQDFHGSPDGPALGVNDQGHRNAAGDRETEGEMRKRERAEAAMMIDENLTGIDPKSHREAAEATDEIEGRLILARETIEEEDLRSPIPQPTKQALITETNGDGRTEVQGQITGPTDTFQGNSHPRESMYPILLGEMIATVLSAEEYLFSEDEVTVLRSYATLPYEARYVFSRLIQRKDTWLRSDAVRVAYQSEVTDMRATVEALVGSFVITHVEAGDDGQETMLSLLTLDELKTLSKRCNVARPGTTKASTISALLKTRSQGTLSSAFFPISPTKRRTAETVSSRAKLEASSKSKQLALNFTSKGRKTPQSVKLAEEVTKLLGLLIRVNPSTRSLIDRVALVFYRGAMLGASALTTAVLSRSRRRNYPRYETQRSPYVFPTREHLLAFEEAVAVEGQMEEILQWGDGTEATFAKALSLFEKIWPIWLATVKDFDQEHPDGPDRMTYHRMRFHAGWPQTRIVYKGTTILARFKLHNREEEVLKALLAQRHFRRGKRGEWYDRLALITAMYSYPENKNKGKSEALKIAVRGIEDPDTHLIYHDQLQKRICRLENQLPIPKSQKHDFSYAKLKQCSEKTYFGVRLDYIDDGMQSRQRLLAPLTNSNRSKASPPAESPEGSRFVSRIPAKKIVKVERQTSPSKQNSSLMKRSFSSSSDLSIDAFQRSESSNHTLESPSSPFDTEGADEATLAQYEVTRKESRTSMASVWRGLDGHPCRVEALVLQHHEREGYRGFHDEGGILKMLFALCLWDIIFHAPGVTDVFETPYQRAPSDMGQDSFCITRGPLLRQRLSTIAQGGAEALIRQVDDRERPTATWALGCRWDAFTQEDLVDVANCIPGQSLAIIFQMMAEEWEHCSGGMPDLLVYRLSDKTVKLCEVKSVNDRLSETQKVWIDVLLRAGVQVELSLVREVEGGGRGSNSPVKMSSGGGEASSLTLKKEVAPCIDVKEEPDR